MNSQEKREWASRRADFLVRGSCAVCGFPPHDVHEILAGANRQAAFKERATWLRVCRPCHDAIQGVGVSYQLAMKFISDPAGFNIPAFCKAWNRPVSAVDTEDVLKYVRTLLVDQNG